jgi:hypothetical protein
MSRTSKILIFSFSLVAVAFIALYLFAATHKRTAKIPACHFNLMQLELCKHEWASDNNKAANDTPTWDDLRPYFSDRWSNSIPVCPAGGTYILGRVDELPRCTIGGGYEHELLR